MSRIAALRRADELFKRIPADNDLRGQSMEAVDFLDDYMRIRFGMQPLDKPKMSVSDTAVAFGRTASASDLPREPVDLRKMADEALQTWRDDRLVVAIMLDGKQFQFYANGNVVAPEFSGVYLLRNNVSALIRREAENLLQERAAEADAGDAETERNHLAALEARDYLQNIMAGLPGSTPHFHELNELLMKLDAMAGTPVARESDQWTAEDANRIDEADLDAAARNMAPGPDYRSPAEWLEAARRQYLDRVSWEKMLDVMYELIQHLDLGRWEIVSHVPDQRDHAADFLKEIERARGEVSVQNPAWKALEEAARKIAGG